MRERERGATTEPARDLPGRWLVLDYEPVAPFSLRTSLGTSSGGKTLLIPTPYAFKLALVDATIRTRGLAAGTALFDSLRACPIAITPSRWASVTNTFGRVLRLHQDKGKKEKEGDSPDGAKGATDAGDDGGEGDDDGKPFKRTIAYREVAILEGVVRLAVGLRQLDASDRVAEAASLVNSFGRRGSFFQLVGRAERDEPDDNAVVVDSVGGGRGPKVIGDVACVLDDTGPRAEFDRINTWSDAKPRVGVERVLRQYLLPMRRVTSSHNFTIYERVDLQA